VTFGFRTKKAPFALAAAVVAEAPTPWIAIVFGVWEPPLLRAASAAPPATTPTRATAESATPTRWFTGTLS
jgi:hypothetical protein